MGKKRALCRTKWNLLRKRAPPPAKDHNGMPCTPAPPRPRPSLPKPSPSERTVMHQHRPRGQTMARLAPRILTLTPNTDTEMSRRRRAPFIGHSRATPALMLHLSIMCPTHTGGASRARIGASIKRPDRTERCTPSVAFNALPCARACVRACTRRAARPPSRAKAHLITAVLLLYGARWGPLLLLLRSWTRCCLRASPGPRTGPGRKWRRWTGCTCGDDRCGAQWSNHLSKRVPLPEWRGWVILTTRRSFQRPVAWPNQCCRWPLS